MTVVRDALSNSVIADDDDYGGESKSVSCSPAARLFSFYILYAEPFPFFYVNAFMNLVLLSSGHVMARKSLGLYLRQGYDYVKCSSTEVELYYSSS